MFTYAVKNRHKGESKFCFATVSHVRSYVSDLDTTPSSFLLFISKVQEEEFFYVRNKE